jgi:hypothetical protein
MLARMQHELPNPEPRQFVLSNRANELVMQAKVLCVFKTYVIHQ